MDKKIKAVIIDDEKLARDIIAKYLSTNNKIQVVGECSNGFEGAKIISEQKPDIVFLDIQMPKINGFELLELIDNPPLVIFTTAFDQYAIKAFEVNAIDYLLKPFSRQRFDEALQKAINKLNSQNMSVQKLNSLNELYKKEEFLNRIVVKANHKIHIIPTDQIRYIEAQDDYVMIYSELGKYLKQKTLKSLADQLDNNQFIRIHRSYIINLNFLKQLELFGKGSYKVITKEGAKLPVSKSGYAKLKEVLS
ncbi:transcriptional regulatory protein YehT [bacterium BMS3Abin04]|nr:transcriptional regulatory protein YehT [bacterium BMS3Abin04]